MAPSLSDINKVRFLLILLSVSWLSSTKGISQIQYVTLASDSFDETPRNESGIRIVNYNVENLFDYFDDSLTLDDEFLPYQGRFWTKEKYLKKQQQLAQVIMASGGWEAPGIIGICEIENRYVLETLTRFTLLKRSNYQIIHKESPDERGIDVALLYRAEKFELLDFDFIPISFPFDLASKTRDILYAKGILQNTDTLHLFVNHWPSKFGGEFETEPKRKFVANVLKMKMDSILIHEPKAKIIAMGDFNDDPSAESLHLFVENQDFINLMGGALYQFGTHSFENEWSLIDQFICSRSLLDPTENSFIKRGDVQIVDHDFLLTEGSLGNKRPFRTYQGPRYLGGFSDHLPILLDISFKN